MNQGHEENLFDPLTHERSRIFVCGLQREREREREQKLLLYLISFSSQILSRVKLSQIENTLLVRGKESVEERKPENRLPFLLLPFK